LKNTFFLYFILLFVAFSCQNDNSDFGVNIVKEGATTVQKSEIDLLAYNFYNNDSIQADVNTLNNVVLGIYDEPVFGKCKAEYLTQVRLKEGLRNPYFGTDSKIEEVTLSIYPSYSTLESDIKVLSEEVTVVNPNNTEKRIKTITEYKLNNLIGDTSKNLKLKVSSLKNYLGNKESKKYSNTFANYEIENELGNLEINDKKITGEVIKDGNGTIKEEIKPSIRISLSNEYFTNLIFEKNALKDDLHLLQYLKGLIINVENENGYFFRFNPNQVELKIKYTNKKDDTSRNTLTYSFDVSSSFNVRNGNYTFTRSEEFLNKIKNPNTTLGDEKLYLQGMGGSRAYIKINDIQIDDLKKRIEKERLAIVSAKIKLHVAEESTSLDKPPYIFANQVTISEGKITNYQVFDDFFVFNKLAGWNFSPIYDSTKNYYELNITQHVQNLIQNKITDNKPILVDVGTFTGTTNPNNNDRAYNPHRLVVYGNNTSNTSKKIKLEIILTKKN
jgi:hypothetical protein